jgi:hypothetical protein
MAKGTSLSAIKCKFQWVRLSMAPGGQIVKARLEGVKTPWYTPTLEDVGGWLRVRASSKDLGQSFVATTSQVRNNCYDIHNYHHHYLHYYDNHKSAGNVNDL